jgi:nucleotide-binding universal stress UspA family protein
MIALQRILVGLDGSPVAESILASVRALAAALGAELVLLHVTPVPEAVRATAAGVAIDLDEIVTHERRRAQVYLDGVAAELRTSGLTVRTATAVGEAATEIVRYAARECVDLVGLATHGRSGVRRWLYGSVADAVLHTTTTPLLLLRPHGGGAEVAAELRRVVAALDGSELAASALPIAARLAAALRVPLSLFRVVETTTVAFAGDPFGAVYTGYERVLAVLREDAERYLGTLATGLRAEGLTVETAVSCGTAVAAIIGHVRTQPGTLLALSTHGRTGWRAVALGSVARRVVLLADGPVLAVRSAPGASAPS